MTSDQLLKLLDEAAEAGRKLASNINNDCVIPDYLFEEQKESFFDAFVSKRQRMYKAKELKFSLMPFDASKGDGVFRKAADCVG